MSFGYKVLGFGSGSIRGPFLVATGGTEVTDGDYKTHIFTGPGSFCVASTGTCAGANVVDYLVVAGGASAGAHGPSTGGGGAGGFRYFSALSPAGSPLVAPVGVEVVKSPYSITVGAGAPKGDPTGPGVGGQGSDSIFSSITSAGGGGGGGMSDIPGADGGSGGGGGNKSGGTTPGGSGNVPTVSPAQGNDGGFGGQLTPGPSGNHRQGGGGGGAGVAGGDVTPSTWGGLGGDGSYIPDGFIGPTAPTYGTAGPVGSTRYFAGGGGGAVYTSPCSPSGGGAGGAGGGSAGAGGPSNSAEDATVNTGGGSGGAACLTPSRNDATGGSGIVMIRYKFQ